MKNARHGFVWITGFLWLISMAAHWSLGWYAYRQEQQQSNHAADVSGYLIEMGRDTMENWQSEFLQLVWQVAGLSFLFCIGSPQSKEGAERTEAKLDFIMSRIEGGDVRRQELDQLYQRGPEQFPRA